MIETTYALADLIADLRALGFGRTATAEQAAAGAAALARLLANPACLAPFGALPAANHNWLLHAEPEDGFTVAALVKAPYQGTGVHDHGVTWTLYGVFAGAETISRYERLDDGSTPGHAELRPSTEFQGQTGRRRRGAPLGAARRGERRRRVDGDHRPQPADGQLPAARLRRGSGDRAPRHRRDAGGAGALIPAPRPREPWRLDSARGCC